MAPHFPLFLLLFLSPVSLLPLSLHRLRVCDDHHIMLAGPGVKNVSASLRIELLSSAGYRLRGYDAASAVPITAVSGVALPAKWSTANTANTAAASTAHAEGSASSRNDDGDDDDDDDNGQGGPTTVVVKLGPKEEEGGGGEVMVRAHLTGGAKLYAINLHGC
jgi:hypothetical protein